MGPIGPAPQKNGKSQKHSIPSPPTSWPYDDYTPDIDDLDGDMDDDDMMDMDFSSVELVKPRHQQQHKAKGWNGMQHQYGEVSTSGSSSSDNGSY